MLTKLITAETDPNEETAYKPKLHDGQKKDGGEDSRVSSEHGFGTSLLHFFAVGYG